MPANGKPKPKPGKPKPGKPKPKVRLYGIARAKGKTASSVLANNPALSLSQRRFLAAYAECGCLTTAAEMIGMSRQNHYWWLASEDYQIAYKEAEAVSVELMEAEARRRAMESSDTLLIFLLKGAKPDKYRERHEHRHGGDPDNPVPIRLTDGQRETKITELLDKARQREEQAKPALGLPDSSREDRAGQDADGTAAG